MCFMKISGTWSIVYEKILHCVSLREECHFRPALLFFFWGQSILTTVLPSATRSEKSKQMTYDELKLFSKLIDVAFR